MTQKQAKMQEAILIDNKYRRLEEAEEERYCRYWFGKDYLGGNLIRCSCCKMNAVEFISYNTDHMCEECTLAWKELS